MNSVQPKQIDLEKEAPAPELSLFLPVLDEEENLRPMHAKIQEALKSLGKTAEVIYVDDGSTDKSLQILREIAAEDEHVRVISLRRNYGQTAAMSAGIDAAKGEILIPMDADLQNDPRDLPLLLEGMRKFDCVCGSRVAARAQGDNFIRILSSRIANWVRNSISGDNISDSGCCFRVFKRECVADLKFFKGMHRFMPTLIKMEGFTVTEVPIRQNHRRSGQSHYNIGNRMFSSFYDLLAVSWMKKRMFRYKIAEKVEPKSLELTAKR